MHPVGRSLMNYDGQFSMDGSRLFAHNEKKRLSSPETGSQRSFWGVFDLILNFLNS